jgi:glycosyltransferase involved in cell wall biosynthesis
VHPSKLNAEAVDSFAAVVADRPDAVLLFAGEEADGGLARRRAETRGLGGRVRFLGRADDSAFLALIAATDVGLALRRPPTNGETSGALLHLLRSGVATIVTETGSFTEYPEGAVRSVPWHDDASGAAALQHALQDLTADPAARAELGRAGRAHVVERHAWSSVAARYAEVIAWASGRDRSLHLYRGPHQTGLSVVRSRGES